MIEGGCDTGWSEGGELLLSTERDECGNEGGMTELDRNVGLSTYGRVPNEPYSSVIESNEPNECSCG